MAAMKTGVIALFDVDGTLTAPRKVCHCSANVVLDLLVYLVFILYDKD